eukprot:scaffold131210_cov67-Attheya_sp.AAC.1
MVGLRNEISADDVIYGYRMINVDLENGVASVLESSVVGQQPSGIGSRFSVKNYNHMDTTCPLGSKAKSCIYVSSAITITASPERSPDEVEQAVVTSLRDSMDPQVTFVEAVGNDYVIEARFGGPSSTPLPTHAPTGTRPPTFFLTKPPTRAPTFSPTHALTKPPTGEPTKPPKAPTEAPTEAPTHLPTKASATLPPSGSPTASPTDGIVIEVHIEYLIGLNDTILTAVAIKSGAKNVETDLQNGLIGVLSPTQNLEGSGIGSAYSAENVNYTDVPCPSDAGIDVASCVDVASVLSVTVPPGSSQEEIQTRVKGVIAVSMESTESTDSFLDHVDNENVIYAHYGGPGSPTASPSSQGPTVGVESNASFSYVLGLSDPNINAEDVERGSEILMSRLQSAIRTILAESFLPSQDRRVLIELSSENGITHSNFIDAICPEDSAPEVVSCVGLTSTVTVTASAQKLLDEVKEAIIEPMKEAMYPSTELVELIDIPILIEARFRSPTVIPDPDPVTKSTSGDSQLSGGEIAGVTVGIFAFFMLAILALMFMRRRDHEDEESEGSWVRVEVTDGETTDFIFIEEGDRSMPIRTAQAERKIAPGPISSSRNLPGFENEAVLSVEAPEGGGGDTFIAATTAAAATATAAVETKRKEKKTRVNASFERLDESAMDTGNWATVTSMAGIFSSSETSGSIKSLGDLGSDILSPVSGGESISDSGSSSSRDIKAKHLNELIDRGDWDAVAATAAMMESDGSTVSGQNMPAGDFSDDNVRLESPSTEMSFFDRITGRSAGASAAAQEAISPSFDNLPATHVSMESQPQMGGAVPILAAATLGAGTIATVAALGRDRDNKTDTKEPTSFKTKNQQGSILQRLGLKKRPLPKEESQYIALQEDSSAASHSDGSFSGMYASSTASPTLSPQRENDKEVDAINTAPKLPRMLDDVSQGTSEGGATQRDELDRAIETGDWSQVETRAAMIDDVSSTSGSSLAGSTDTGMFTSEDEAFVPSHVPRSDDVVPETVSRSIPISANSSSKGDAGVPVVAAAALGIGTFAAATGVAARASNDDEKSDTQESASSKAKKQQGSILKRM